MVNSDYNSEFVHTYHPLLDIYVRPEEIHLSVIFLHEQIKDTTTRLNGEALQAILIAQSYLPFLFVFFLYLLMHFALQCI